MTDLVQEIESEIAGLKTATVKQSIGVIREIGDGVARVEGLTDVMLDEMLEATGGPMTEAERKWADAALGHRRSTKAKKVQHS